MMLMITRIDKSNIEPFLNLMHEDIADEIIVGKSLAIGALDSDTAAGIAVFNDEYLHDEGEYIVNIKWLFVHPDHRGLGIGDEIMSSLILSSDEAGADAIKVTFDENNSSMREYLEEWGFSFNNGWGTEIALSFRDIKNHKSILMSGEKVAALSDIDKDQAFKLIRRYLKKSGYKGFLLEECLPEEYIDFDVSGFMGSSENPTGLILVHYSKEGKLLTEFLSCDDKEIGNDISLLGFACLNSMSKYPPNSLLIIKPDTMEFIMNLDAVQLFKKHMMQNLTDAILLREDWEEN